MKGPGIKSETQALEALLCASMERCLTGHEPTNSDGMLFLDSWHDAKTSPGSDKKSKPNVLVRPMTRR